MGQQSGESDPEAAGWHWTRHWRSGAHHSCSGLAGAGSSSVLETLWTDFARDLPPGAKLADLACGCGQAAAWAALARPDLLVTGVDLAEIPPADDIAAPIRLVGGVPLERLVFADAELDAVISQFGFEYGELTAAAAEVGRVLRPGGRGLFVVHHAGSGISLNYAMRGEAFRAAVTDLDVYGRARDVFIRHRDAAPPTEIIVAEKEFRDLLITAQSRIVDAPPQIEAWQNLRYLRELAVHPGRFAPRSAIERLEVAAAEARAWLLRYDAQKAAALDVAGAMRMATALQAAGLDCPIPEAMVGDAGDVLAWRFAFSRPG